MTAILSAATLRLALISRRSLLIHHQKTFPECFSNDEINATIKSIDEALYEIEGNITEVMISPITCKLNA